MRKTHNLIMLIGVVAVVYGCSSGGSSSPNMTVDPTELPAEDPTRVEAPTGEAESDNTERQAQPNTGGALEEEAPPEQTALRPDGTYEAPKPGDTEAFRAGRQAANNNPLRGSVTQGENVAPDDDETTGDHFTITRKEGDDTWNAVIVNIDVAHTEGIDFPVDATDTTFLGTPPEPVMNDAFPYNRRAIHGVSSLPRFNMYVSDTYAGLNPPCREGNLGPCQPPGGSLSPSRLAGMEIELVDWTDEDDSYYLGGGNWEYGYFDEGAFDTPGDPIGRITFTRGVFVDGDDANLTSHPLPSTGSAMYRGKSLGTSFELPRPFEGTSYGSFTADTTLWVDFSGTPSIRGVVENFIFSIFYSLANFETQTPRSLSYPTLRVVLEETEVSATNNFFEGDTRSTGLLLDEDDDESELVLRGKWGGRFYGTPPNVGDAPLGIGGTWGADGARGDASDLEALANSHADTNGAYSLVLLASFGTKRPDELERPLGVAFKAPQAQEALDVARQTGFAAAAGGTAVFVDGDDTAVSSATQGGATDRVYLTRTGSDVASLTIDVGNAGTATLVLNATGEAGDSDSNVVRALAGPGTGDRRLNTRISGGADDPSWDYDTRRLTISTDERTAITNRLEGTGTDTEKLGDGVVFYEADLVDWTDADDGYYMAGGVWSYYDAASLTSDIEVTAGAFIDGDATDITANPLPTTGEATYTGHSYGRYTTLPVPSEADINAGHFAATASLTANFGAPTPQVSGRIENFLFSPRGTFLGRRPDLQAALRRTVVNLGDAPVTGNQFSGPTTTNGVFLDRANAADQGEIELTGTWAGRFFGAAGDATTPEAPPAVGGTWGAAGGTDLAPEDGGFSISFIGSFGAKR